MLCVSLVTVLGMGGLAWAAGSPDPESRPGAPVADTVSRVSASGSADGVATLAAVGGQVYALAADGSAVYRATDRDTWKKIGGGAAALYGGGAGLFATSPADGSVLRYQPPAPGEADGTWTPVGGPAAAFAVGQDKLYALAGDRSSVSEWDPSSGWRTIGGPAQDIHAGGAGLFATSPAGDVYRYEGSPTASVGDAAAGVGSDTDRWTRIGGPGAEFVVGGDRLYGLAPDRSSVSEWTKETGWRTIGGPAQHLYGGPEGLVTTDPATGNAFVRTRAGSAPAEWRMIGGPGATFLSLESDPLGNTTVLGVAPDRSAVLRYTSKDGAWVRTAGTVESSSITQRQAVDLVSGFFQPGQESFNAWARARGARLVDKRPDPYGLRWDHDGCSKSPDQPAGFDFTGACIRHDFGYRNFRDLLGEDGFRNGVAGLTGIGPESPKARVDAVFLQDLRKECNRPIGSGVHIQARPRPMVEACEQFAERYHASVVTLG
ncbi:phospholipase A2 [Streptomyces sp. NPDC047725]|uniref:phospholipase A2 n=1 Tax=Streptomyces sp. NPDC047725 TaxID=3365487 RepID=UPI003719B9B7